MTRLPGDSPGARAVIAKFEDAVVWAAPKEVIGPCRIPARHHIGQALNSEHAIPGPALDVPVDDADFLMAFPGLLKKKIERLKTICRNLVVVHVLDRPQQQQEQLQEQQQPSRSKGGCCSCLSCGYNCIRRLQVGFCCHCR